MMNFLTTAPLWLEILLVVIIPTAIAMLGPLLVRRFVPLEDLSFNNEVAGFKFATIGVTYAVLPAFSIIVVWEKFSDAESTVEREAGAAATIYRLSDGLVAPKNAAVRATMTAYLKSAIHEEWPAMEHSRANKPTWQSLGGIYQAMLIPGAADDVSIKTEIFNQLSTITQARRARLIAAAVPSPSLFGELFSSARFWSSASPSFSGRKSARPNIDDRIAGVSDFLGTRDCHCARPAIRRGNKE